MIPPPLRNQARPNYNDEDNSESSHYDEDDDSDGGVEMEEEEEIEDSDDDEDDEVSSAMSRDAQIQMKMMKQMRKASKYRGRGVMTVRGGIQRGTFHGGQVVFSQAPQRSRVSIVSPRNALLVRGTMNQQQRGNTVYRGPSSQTPRFTPVRLPIVGSGVRPASTATGPYNRQQVQAIVNAQLLKAKSLATNSGVTRPIFAQGGTSSTTDKAKNLKAVANQQPMKAKMVSAGSNLQSPQGSGVDSGGSFLKKEKDFKLVANQPIAKVKSGSADLDKDVGKSLDCIDISMDVTSSNSAVATTPSDTDTTLSSTTANPESLAGILGQKPDSHKNAADAVTNSTDITIEGCVLNAPKPSGTVELSPKDGESSKQIRDDSVEAATVTRLADINVDKMYEGDIENTAKRGYSGREAEEDDEVSDDEEDSEGDEDDEDDDDEDDDDDGDDDDDDEEEKEKEKEKEEEEEEGEAQNEKKKEIVVEKKEICNVVKLESETEELKEGQIKKEADVEDDDKDEDDDDDDDDDDEDDDGSEEDEEKDEIKVKIEEAGPSIEVVEQKLIKKEEHMEVDNKLSSSSNTTISASDVPGEIKMESCDDVVGIIKTECKESNDNVDTKDVPSSAVLESSKFAIFQHLCTFWLSKICSFFYI